MLKTTYYQLTFSLELLILFDKMLRLSIRPNTSLVAFYYVLKFSHMCENSKLLHNQNLKNISLKKHNTTLELKDLNSLIVQNIDQRHYINYFKVTNKSILILNEVVLVKTFEEI